MTGDESENWGGSYSWLRVNRTLPDVLTHKTPLFFHKVISLQVNIPYLSIIKTHVTKCSCGLVSKMASGKSRLKLGKLWLFSNSKRFLNVNNSQSCCEEWFLEVKKFLRIWWAISFSKYLHWSGLSEERLKLERRESRVWERNWMGCSSLF